MAELYFDKQGKPLKQLEWVALLENRDYVMVGKTTVNDRYLISTIWLGLNHNFFGGPPLIFETMIFDKTNDGRPHEDIEMMRYATEKEALEGHEQMVQLVTVLEGLSVRHE